MEKQKYYHKHHIIPKHMGGNDDPTNIVELTPDQHAEAHRILFEAHGKWQDYIAWQGLSGRMTQEDIIRQKARLGNMGRIPWHKGKKIGPRSDATKQKISNTMKSKHIRPSNETLRKAQKAAHEAVRGRHVSDEERQRRSASLKAYNEANPRPFRARSTEAKQKTSLKLQKPLMYKNVYYTSLKQCIAETNTTRYWIVNDPSFAWV